MSLNQEFETYMNDSVVALVGGADVNDTTGHATLSLNEDQFPEGISPTSLLAHANFINNVGVQVETAAAQLGRAAYEGNNQLTTFDATLALPGVTINSQYHLKQEIGDQTLYGQSTTATDFQYAAELNSYQEQMSASNAELAAKYFG